MSFSIHKSQLTRQMNSSTSFRNKHPTKHQLYGHLPPITKTIQMRRTRHEGHSWRSKDDLISNVFLLTPAHGGAGVGRPTRTYLQQLCTDTGYSLEDIPEVMDDSGECRERVREILASSTRWWWWLWWWRCSFRYTIS